MADTVEQAIQLAKQVLANNRHAAMATVNEDGTPHNTPFFFLYDAGFKHIYWGSHPDAQHSRNVERTGEVFVVSYDSREQTGGVYLKADNAHVLSGDELNDALAVHNEFRVKEGKAPIPLAYYTGASPQKMYAAQPVACWVLMIERAGQGSRIRDYRQEIPLSALNT